MGLRNPHDDALTRGDYLAQPDLRAGVKESYVNAPMVPVHCEEWTSRAACKGRTDLFFPPDERGATANARVRECRLICSRCPVFDQCLDTAIADPGLMGIWAGTHPKQRIEIRAGRMTRPTRSPGPLCPASIVEDCAKVFGTDIGRVFHSRNTDGRATAARRAALLLLLDREGYSTGDAAVAVGYARSNASGVVRAARRQLRSDPWFGSRVLEFYGARS